MFEISHGPKLRQYAIVITVNFGVLWVGMALGWSSPAMVKLSNSTETVMDSPVTESDGSWIVSAGYLTSTFVGLATPHLLDRIGRKNSAILASVPHIIASLIIIFAKEVWEFILARVLVGVSLAICFNVSPTYAADIASKEIRGSLGTILQISCCVGITIMLGIGPFVSYLTLNVIYATIVIVTAMPMLFLPESPYYLYTKGRTVEALEILTKIRGSDILAKQELAEYETAKIDTIVDHKSLLKDTIFLKTIALVITFAILVQICGSNAIALYLQPILDSTKTNVSSEIASAVIGLIKLIGGVITASITDRFGRKPILVWTYFGMTVGMIGFGSCYIVSNEAKEMYTIINYIPLICLILTIFCNSAGQGSLLNTVVPELFEGPTRALGVSIAFFTGSLFTFLTAKYLGAFVALLGPAIAYWSFGIISFLGAMFVIFCLPETKGKSFAEIQRILGRKEPDHV